MGGSGTAEGGATTTAGGAGSTPSPPAGCLSLCVPSAVFVLQGLGPEIPYTHAFTACRNRECFQGGPFRKGESSRIVLENLGTASASMVDLSLDSPSRLTLSWSRLSAGPDGFADGDHYTLEVFDAAQWSFVIDEVVTYGLSNVCGAPCTSYQAEHTLPAVDVASGGGGESSN